MFVNESNCIDYVILANSNLLLTQSHNKAFKHRPTNTMKEIFNQL